MTRTIIPVCKNHKRFQTEGGRWLDMATDLESHIQFTNSEDAVLSEGECDQCFNSQQTKMVFVDKDPYENAHNLLLDSGMFWVFYPQLTGKWEEDKVEFSANTKL